MAHFTVLDTIDGGGSGGGGGGVTDHGALTGLADNDHPQYMLDDVMDRQTLGADAQEVTIPLNEAWERITVEGFGAGSQVGTTNYSMKFNTTLATSGCVYTTETATVFGENDRWAICIDDGAVGFSFHIDLRQTGFLIRGASGTFWSMDNGGSPLRRFGASGVAFIGDSTPITQVILVASNSTGFRAGFKFITRSRKMSA